MTDIVNPINLAILSRLIDAMFVAFGIFAGVFPAVWLALRLASRRND